MEKEKQKVAVEYEKPDVKDYGDLRELTAVQHKGTNKDVPLGDVPQAWYIHLS
jgi:hypothetical protein